MAKGEQSCSPGSFAMFGSALKEKAPCHRNGMGPRLVTEGSRFQFAKKGQDIGALIFGNEQHSITIIIAV